jgi:nucleotide-binding universal stress UspA family protein
MSFDFLLPLLTFPDPSDKDAVRRGLDLAATLGGRVTIQVNEVDIPSIRSVLGELLIDLSAMIASAESRSRAAADDLERETRAGAERLDLPLLSHHVRVAPESIADGVAIAARTFDYCILPECGDLQATMAEAVLFGSGGPVLLLPTSDTAFHLQVVTVAWDGSRAAARAVRDALPILQRARKVVLLCVSDDKPMDSALNEALADHLRQRAIACEFSIVTRQDQSISECLQKASLAAGAGLLVMGAYGHSRMREWVLGGATRGVLSRRQLTVLMSH